MHCEACCNFVQSKVFTAWVLAACNAAVAFPTTLEATVNSV